MNRANNHLQAFAGAGIRATIAALIMALLVACGGSEPSPTASTLPTSTVAALPSPTAVASPTNTVAALTSPTSKPAATATTALGADQFVNPIISKDFPDPDVLKVGDTYYIYATNSGSINVQVASSTDLVTWKILTDALPVLPKWASPGNTWAPEVTTWDEGKTFVLYFTARIKGGGSQCIGAASSDKPQGPFKAVSDEAFICDLGEGGDIDTSSFRDDDGTSYILWKNDGNCCGGQTNLYIQHLSADGLTREGERTALINASQVWEGIVTEAPTLWKNEGKYYLFYSGNAYNTLNYAVGYAVADNILGPYTKPQDAPILFTNTKKPPTALGPGGQDIVVAPNGQTWMVYHSWDPTVTNRRINIDELVFENGVPVVKGPDLIPQQRPQ